MIFAVISFSKNFLSYEEESRREKSFLIRTFFRKITGSFEDEFLMRKKIQFFVFD